MRERRGSPGCRWFNSSPRNTAIVQGGIILHQSADTQLNVRFRNTAEIGVVVPVASRRRAPFKHNSGPRVHLRRRDLFLWGMMSSARLSSGESCKKRSGHSSPLGVTKGIHNVSRAWIRLIALTRQSFFVLSHNSRSCAGHFWKLGRPNQADCSTEAPSRARIAAVRDGTAGAG